MEEIKKIKNDFEMGFISPHEFLIQLKHVFFEIGVAGELEETVNEVLLPLVNFIIGDVLNAPECSKKCIKDFSKKEA